MMCLAARRRFADLFSEAEPGRAARKLARVRAHIDGCRACREKFAALQHAEHELVRLETNMQAELAASAPPPGMGQRVMETMRRLEDEAEARAGASGWAFLNIPLHLPSAALGGAAAAAIALLFFSTSSALFAPDAGRGQPAQSARAPESAGRANSAATETGSARSANSAVPESAPTLANSAAPESARNLAGAAATAARGARGKELASLVSALATQRFATAAPASAFYAPAAPALQPFEGPAARGVRGGRFAGGAAARPGAIGVTTGQPRRSALASAPQQAAPSSRATATTREHCALALHTPACKVWRTLMLYLAAQDAAAFMQETAAVPAASRTRWLDTLASSAAQRGASQSIIANLRAYPKAHAPLAQQTLARFEAGKLEAGK